MGYHRPCEMEKLVGVVETSIFTVQIDRWLSAEELADLHWSLATRPQQGSIIRGSGGLRKLRWAVAGRGKRGGLRIIYYWFGSDGRIFLLYVYRKSEQSDLSRTQIRMLRQLVEEATC